MASITWDPGDSAGPRTLECVVEEIGRFNRWKILPKVVGEEAEAVGDGRGYKWAHRTDYAASFDLIFAHADLALAHEFVEWADAFNPFTITTEDAEANEYDECQKKVGTDIDISPPDPETLDHVLTMTVLNVAVTPVPLIIKHE